MKKIYLIATTLLSILFVLHMGLHVITKETHYVYACRAEEKATDCGRYEADVEWEPMDGIYITAIHRNDPAELITFESISQDDSYDKGCWLDRKKGANGIFYNACKSSSGEWTILTGPTKRDYKF